MTPVEEIEYIIKEIAVNEIDYTKSYTIKSFPEIYFLKHKFYYTVEIFHDHHQNANFIKRFKEFRNELLSRKITIENKILDMDRNILFEGNYSDTIVHIYYKNCVFTSPYVVNDTCCENCIIEKE